MVDVPHGLRTLFTAEIHAADTEHEGGQYRVSIPSREVDNGGLDVGENYRIAILPELHSQSSSVDDTPREQTSGDPDTEDGPPVTEGEVRELEIDSLGDQGDGIAKVGNGFVVIVPGTEVGQTVRAEVQNVKKNLAFADTVSI